MKRECMPGSMLRAFEDAFVWLQLLPDEDSHGPQHEPLCRELEGVLLGKSWLDSSLYSVTLCRAQVA